MPWTGPMSASKLLKMPRFVQILSKTQHSTSQVRAIKAEEEVAELVKKSQQLEVELDKTQEELTTTTEKLNEKENALTAAELEVNSLNRRVQSIEGDLETCEDKLLMASQKLDKAATAADDSDRMRKVLEINLLILNILLLSYQR